MTLELERRRKPSPRRLRKQTRPAVPCDDTAVGRVINIVIDGEVVDATEIGNPRATRAIRLALASALLGVFDFPLLVLLHYAGEPLPALTTALYLATAAFLALAVAAWVAHYNRHRSGGTQ